MPIIKYQQITTKNNETKSIKLHPHKYTIAINYLTTQLSPHIQLNPTFWDYTIHISQQHLVLSQDISFHPKLIRISSLKLLVFAS